MKKYLLVISSLLMLSTLSAQETGESYDLEESSCDGDVCVPHEFSYYRRYHTPHRYNNYYDYEDRDIDATWPGKQENSFMEDLMR